MNQRLERVNNVIRDEISDMLRRDLHDPLIGFVTITGVEVSADLRHAKVFFSVLGDAEQVQNSIKGLLRARKFINSRLAERVELRFIPKLRFVHDDTAARAQQMSSLLNREQEELAEALARHQAEEAAAPATPKADEPLDELDELDRLDAGDNVDDDLEDLDDLEDELDDLEDEDELDDEEDWDEDEDDDLDEDEDFEDEEEDDDDEEPVK